MSTNIKTKCIHVEVFCWCYNNLTVPCLLHSYSYPDNVAVADYLLAQVKSMHKEESIAVLKRKFV